MGVHVFLDINPRGIDATEWARAYDDTLGLLESWQPRLLGWKALTIETERVPVYARSIRSCVNAPSEAACSVVGDRESMQTAECQNLYRDLGRYLKRARHDHGEEDIVVAAANPECRDTSGPANVFGDKTQGYPYHFAMLAAGMLIEERFPKHAMVWGDIDRGQAERARSMAAPWLGRDLALPVRVDPGRLLERLRAKYQGEALVAAFARISLDDPVEQYEGVLRSFPGQDGARHWLQALTKYEQPTVGAIELLIAWLNAGRDLREACRLACIDPEGPRFAPERFVAALASTTVAAPVPSREILSYLRKPKGAAHTIGSLFTSWVLDSRGALGRHLRVRIEPATVASMLGEVFGPRAPALVEHFSAERAKQEKPLLDHAREIQATLDGLAREPNDDTESLVTLHSPDAMGANQRGFVHAMAHATQRLLDGLLREPEGERLMDAKMVRLLLVRALRTRGPILTEDAWDELLALSDLNTIAWLVCLTLVSIDELRMSQVRRALFENVPLRRYAIAAAHDPKLMAEVEEALAAAQARKKRGSG